MIRAASQKISGIIRVGVDYEGHPQDWDYQAAYASTDGRHAVMLGLKGDGRFGPAHKTAIGYELWVSGFRTVEWERVFKKDGKFVSRNVPLSEPRLRALYLAQLALLAAAGLA